MKNILGRAGEAITLLLTGFSGFFTTIAPPEETGIAYTLGAASTIAAVIYIIILVLAHGRLKAEHKKYWFVVAVFFFSVFLFITYKYNGDREQFTFLWPPREENQELKVAGETLTPEAQKAKQTNPSLTSAQLVSGFGGIEERTKVWTEESIRNAGTRLKVDYAVMFLSLATTIFCLVEGILLRTPPANVGAA